VGAEGATVLEWLLRADAEAGWAAVATAAAALTWPDESISRACTVCKRAFSFLFLPFRSFSFLFLPARCMG